MGIWNAQAQRVEYPAPDLATTKAYVVLIGERTLIVGHITQGRDFDGSPYFYATSVYTEEEWTSGRRASAEFWLFLEWTVANRRPRI